MVNAFTSEEKKLIVDYIESKPIKVVEAIDTDKKTVTYSKDLKGKTITTLPGDEEITRAYILTRLVNELGYSIENIELEHEYTAGRPHTNTSIIDIIVRDENNDAFLFIEVKSPEECASIDKDKTIEEQLFKVAGMERTEGHKVKYLMLYTLDINGTDITDDCMIIDSDAMCRQVRGDSDACYVKEDGKTCPTEILERLAEYNAEGRPIWKPMHMQPVFKNCDFISVSERPVNEEIFSKGLCLPSDIKMTEDEQTYVIEAIKECF